VRRPTQHRGLVATSWAASPAAVRTWGSRSHPDVTYHREIVASRTVPELMNTSS